MPESALEAEFRVHCRSQQLPAPIREYKFHPTRRWRFDFAWPAYMLAVELEGGIWSRGRHTRAQGFIADCEKYNAATELGWSVLRFTKEHLKDLSAVEVTRRCLDRLKEK